MAIGKKKVIDFETNTCWNSLSATIRMNLEKLGFDEMMWDNEQLPIGFVTAENRLKKFNELSPHQKETMAILEYDDASWNAWVEKKTTQEREIDVNPYKVLPWSFYHEVLNQKVTNTCRFDCLLFVINQIEKERKGDGNTISLKTKKIRS